MNFFKKKDCTLYNRLPICNVSSQYLLCTVCCDKNLSNLLPAFIMCSPVWQLDEWFSSLTFAACSIIFDFPLNFHYVITSVTNILAVSPDVSYTVDSDHWSRHVLLLFCNKTILFFQNMFDLTLSQALGMSAKKDADFVASSKLNKVSQSIRLSARSCLKLVSFICQTVFDFVPEKKCLPLVISLCLIRPAVLQHLLAWISFKWLNHLEGSYYLANALWKYCGHIYNDHGK